MGLLLPENGLRGGEYVKWDCNHVLSRKHHCTLFTSTSPPSNSIPSSSSSSAISLDELSLNCGTLSLVPLGALVLWSGLSLCRASCLPRNSPGSPFSPSPGSAPIHPSPKAWPGSGQPWVQCRRCRPWHGGSQCRGARSKGGRKGARHRGREPRP